MNKQLFLCFALPLLALHGYHQERAKHVVKKAFSYAGLKLSIRQKTEIEKLLYHIYIATPYQQATAAKQANSLLIEEFNKKKTHFEQAHESDKAIIHHNAGILVTQIRHLQNFARVTLHHVAWIDRIKGFFANLWQKIQVLVGKIPTTNITQLTEELVAYTRLEREYIFKSYRQTQHLIAAQKQKNIPPLIRFWDHHNAQFELLRGIKQFEAVPKLQAAEIAEVAVETGAETVGTAAAEGAATELGDTGVFVAEQLTTEEATELAANFKQLQAVTQQLLDTGALTDELTTTFARIAEANAKSVAPWGDIIQAFQEAGQINEEIASMLTENLSTLSQEAAAQSAEKSVSELLDFFKREAVEGPLPEGVEDPLYIQNQPADYPEEFESLQKQLTEINPENKIVREGDILKERIQIAKNKLGALIDENLPAEKLVNQLEKLKGELSKLEGITKTVATNSGRKALLQAIKDISNELSQPLKQAVRTVRLETAANMIKEMALQMGLMSGAQMAASWVSQQDAELYLQLSQQRNQITSNFQAALSQMNAAKSAKIDQIQANFSAKMLDLSNAQKNLISLLSEQKNYLMQSLVTTAVKQLYVSDNQMDLDHYFYLAPMLTPQALQTPLFTGVTSVNTNWQLPTHSTTPPAANTSIKWYTSSSVAASQESSSPIVSNQQLALPTSLPANPIAHTWYNVFRIGNWQFDYRTNSFYQYKAVKVDSATAPEGDAQQALYNAIITEYIPPKIINAQGEPTYVIQAELQIYSALYPFFAGIIFNSGRWVSGVLDLFYQHRLFGLHGTPAKTIEVCAGETFYLDDKAGLSILDAIWPLKQIMATQTEKSDWNAFSSTVIPNPVYPTATDTNPIQLQVGKTYILTITTQASKIMVQLDEKSNQSNIKIFGPLVIANRNPFVALYHNIGFVSAGCSARFTLLQPQQLAYDTKTLDSFGASLSSSGSKQ